MNERKNGFSRLQNMPSYSDLVQTATGDEKEYLFGTIGPKISDLSEVKLLMSEMHAFKNHPFKVVDDEAMQSLSDSIRNRGVLHPIIVRKDDLGYEIISGHRRQFAALKAGLTEIPAYIVDLSDEDAIILMADANFYQREKLFPSEKAKAYRMKSDAIARHPGLKGKYTIEEIGEGTNDSATQVKRFLRLSYLEDNLLNMIDEKKLGIDQGVQLSYISAEHQKIIYDVLQRNGSLKVSVKQAKRIRDNEWNFSEEMITTILLQKDLRRKKYFINGELLNRYFDENITEKELDDIISKALSIYFEKKGDTL